jgi:hypothetical protein
VTKDINLSQTLREVRAYTEKNAELKKSHHFLFNLPLETNTQNADVIVIGLNPGEHDSDWHLHDRPTEETDEFDFHNEFGNGRSSLQWSKNCINFLPNQNIYLSEFFFWSSNSTRKKGFDDRFGYSFKDCPHLDFCMRCNLDMISSHKPKLIVATGLTYAQFFSSKYNLTHIKTVNRHTDKNKRRIIIHYELEGVPFIFTTHWTGAFGVSNSMKDEIKSYLGKFIQT